MQEESINTSSTPLKAVTVDDVLKAFPGSRVVAAQRCRCVNVNGLLEIERDRFVCRLCGRRAGGHIGHRNRSEAAIAETVQVQSRLDPVFSSFFPALFGKTKGNIELRAFPSRRRIFSRDYKELHLFIEEHVEEEVYFGVATRRENDGTKAGLCEARCLWVDIDWKDFQGGEHEAHEIVEAFAPKPSIIVQSGNGWHLYFLLAEPVALDNDDDIRQFERRLKGLCLALRGDRAAAEAARLLRVPHTFNRKYGKETEVTFKVPE
jgi:hypothetical protein